MEWIAKQIILLHDAGASFSDFAILFRSTYLSQSIEQELLREHLPYTVWGGVRFFERKEIKDCLSYLRLINNPEDDLAFSRIANVPSRKMGKAFMERLKASASSSGQSLFNTLKDKVSCPEYSKTGAVSFVAMIDECRELAQASAVSDLLNRVLAESGLKKEIRENQDEDRLENVDELLHSIRFYEESHKDDEITLSDYLQDIALYTNADYRKDTSVIKLMTIHQAKGLEFPYVFIIGLSEGTFPNMRTIREYKKNGEEEERRLMYVAVTRAEKALFLTESEGFNVSTKMNKYPSRFLTEIQREMFVTEGFVPEELWKGTKNLKHVLDEEIYGNPVEPSSGVDGFAAERAEYHSGFEVGDEVVHKVFGEGVIISANSEWTSFQVQFQDGTIRQIRSSFLSFPDLPE
jgi:DNA helicase-2/ATP-dependent DNA helicase PcrA